jgi:hypothetical protein
MNEQEIVAELEAIEADPPPCLPDEVCCCQTCERYVELYGLLDEIQGRKDR